MSKFLPTLALASSLAFASGCTQEVGESNDHLLQVQGESKNCKLTAKSPETNQEVTLFGSKEAQAYCNPLIYDVNKQTSRAVECVFGYDSGAADGHTEYHYYCLPCTTGTKNTVDLL